MKKISSFAYVLLMGILVFSLSGCGGGSSNNGSDEDSSTTPSKLMVVTSTAFKKGETYSLFRGSDVSAIHANNSRVTSKYYISEDRGSEPLSLNLEFEGNASNDVPFLITVSGDSNVVFYYNPNGTGNDTTSSGVVRYGGAQQKREYSGLTLSSLSTSGISASTIEIDESDVVTITLNDDGTATYTSGDVSGSIPANDLIWAVSEDQPGEYWFWSNEPETRIFDEDDIDEIDSVEGLGLYIAHDIRYVPDTLTFSESVTVPKALDDDEPMFVAYYSTKADGVDEENKYIVAALPQPTGSGGGGGAPEGEGPNGGENNQPPSPPSIGASANNFETIKANMTHSAADAYNNPVLHITKPGTYKLKGTWNGQIWIDSGKKTDASNQVALILDGVTVNCKVAPALVFKKVYECYPDSSNIASEYTTINDQLINEGEVFAGALVVIADGSKNTFTGTNVARLNEIKANDDEEYEDGSLIGKYVKAQGKLYKLDGAFHSRMSMIIRLQDGATDGTLNVNSDYEGLNSEMHLLINSGTVNVTAEDDGINVNEDGVSVFYMEGGTVTVKSSSGDGVDSNGYIVINGGTLYVSAGQQAYGNEAGVDADKNIEISEGTYYWARSGSEEYSRQSAYSGTGEGAENNNPGNGNNEPGNEPGGNSDAPSTPPDNNNNNNVTTPPAAPTKSDDNKAPITNNNTTTETQQDNSQNTTTNGNSNGTGTSVNNGTQTAFSVIDVINTNNAVTFVGKAKTSANDMTPAQRMALGVAASGMNYKFVDTNNSFSGIK